jgi:two-component system, OmpR family, response regulator MtrA
VARILVAEDDPDIRLLLVMKLRSAGHEVTEVADGDAAVDAAHTSAPDLLLLDLMMPGRTGIEVCETLREEDAFADVPMILLTARAQEQDVERGLAAGATAYLSKPFSPRELIDTLDPYLPDGA